MRIPCPFCGDRDTQEFVYRGDAGVPVTDIAKGVFEAIYLRDNVAGVLREHWYHAQGCRNWLVVTRDTRTHEIQEAAFSSGAVR